MCPSSRQTKFILIWLRFSRSSAIYSRCSILQLTSNSWTLPDHSPTSPRLSSRVAYSSSSSSLLIEKFLESWWWQMSSRAPSARISSWICRKSSGAIETFNFGLRLMDAAFFATWFKITASTRLDSGRELNSSWRLLDGWLTKLIEQSTIQTSRFLWMN